MDDIDVDDVDEISSDEMDGSMNDELDDINIEEDILYNNDVVELPNGPPTPTCFNIALIGHWRHGKTIFLDMVAGYALNISTIDEGNGKHKRFTDTRDDEKEAEMSVRTFCDCHIFTDSNSTEFPFNFLDSPGHVDFSDEMTVALRLADGAVLVVDAADGVMVNTTRAIHHAVTDGLPIVVVINKVDRLITELKLSPEDAYCKLRRIIEVINNHICERTPTDGSYQKINPAAGNVCFASGSAGWCFTLQSFAQRYTQLRHVPFHADRIYSGTLTKGSLVKVLREGSHPDEENWVTETITVTNMWYHEAGEWCSIAEAYAGLCVYFEGFGDTLERNATLLSSLEVNPLHAFRPLQFNTLPVLKIAVNVKTPSELPRLMHGMSMINKNYPLASVSCINPLGPTIVCTGSKCLDFILNEVKIYSGTQVEVLGHFPAFCETVTESAIAETRGQNFKMKMVVEPLEPSAAEDMENGVVRVDMPRGKLGDYFQAKYDWDLHDATSIWAFGPRKQGPNVLLDYTCLQEVDQRLLDVVKGSIVKGFQQGVNHGPLCNERVRNVKFKIVDVTIAQEASQQYLTHISQIVQLATHSALCKAKPRLMEPVYYVEIQTPYRWISSIHKMLYERWGDIIFDVPQLESTCYVVKAFLSVRGSYGFEETLQGDTNYEASATLTFNHWTIVPGDPLDSTIESHARECMLLIRHNKGMLGDPQALLVEQDDSDQQH